MCTVGLDVIISYKGAQGLLILTLAVIGFPCTKVILSDSDPVLLFSGSLTIIN